MFNWMRLNCWATVPSYYIGFNTGKREILPCVGCDQLPFQVALLVVTRYRERLTLSISLSVFYCTAAVKEDASNRSP